jgi:hypothetical protein
LGLGDLEAKLPPEVLGMLSPELPGAMKVDGLPVSKCSGGNCRSAPDQPPVDPSRTVVLRRQPAGLQINTLDLDLSIASAFAWLNVRLPLSVSLEVTTPPPIISA